MGVGVAPDEREPDVEFRESLRKAGDKVADRPDRRREGHDFGESLELRPCGDPGCCLLHIREGSWTAVVGLGPRDPIGEHRAEGADAVFS